MVFTAPKRCALGTPSFRKCPIQEPDSAVTQPCWIRAIAAPSMSAMQSYAKLETLSMIQITETKADASCDGK
jgi:hypothetical protein